MNRLVEAVYRLKDLFTAPAAKIKAGYKEVGDAAEKAADRTEKVSKRFGGAVGAVVGKIAGIGTALAGLGATAGFKAFLTGADRSAKLARSLNITTESLGELRLAADLNGIEFEQLATSLAKMSKSAGEAVRGNKQLADTFDAIGISTDELKTLKPDELFERIADGLQNLGSRVEQQAALNLIFGRAWREFIVLIDQGSAGIQKFRQLARATGETLDTVTAAAAEKLNDQLRVLGGQLRGPDLSVFWPDC